MNKLWEATKIMGVTTILCCVFGVLHDQVTARISLPYFTQFHPNLGLPNNPTVIAIVWGIFATWWVGALLGAALALACLRGNRPPVPLGRLWKGFSCLFVFCTVIATLAGALGFAIGADMTPMAYPVTAKWPQDQRSRLAADIFAHNASYLAAATGGVVLVAWVIYLRKVDYKTLGREQAPNLTPR